LFSQGGWGFLDLEKSDEGEDEDEASSDGFEPGSEADGDDDESSEDMSDEVGIWGPASRIFKLVKAATPCIHTVKPSCQRGYLLRQYTQTRHDSHAGGGGGGRGCGCSG